MSLILILLASVLGSPHCAAMCGGFAAVSSQNSAPIRGQIAYHFGRLLTYVALGALAGALGSALDGLGVQAGVSHAAAIVTGTLLCFSGISMLFGRSLSNMKLFPANLVAILRKNFIPERSRTVLFPLMLGLFSTLLPCGWLYSYVAVAAASASAAEAVMVMLFFWLGTLPILLTVGSLSSIISTPLKKYVPTVISLLLISAGLFSLGSHLHLVPFSQQHSNEHCAMPKDHSR